MADILTKSLVVIPAPIRLLTVNAERRIHYARRSEIVRQWRWAAKLYTRQAKVQPYEWCEITMHVKQARGVLADPGAHYPVLKACVDGIVDAGILPSDDGRYVRSIVQQPPMRGNRDEIRITLAGVRSPPRSVCHGESPRNEDEPEPDDRQPLREH